MRTGITACPFCLPGGGDVRLTERNAVYKQTVWKHLREKVMKMDKCQCQRCLGVYDPNPERPKRIKKAVLVHHHFPVKDYPQWKYSIYAQIDGKKVRNLYSLCFDCHEIVEGRRSDAVLFQKEADEAEFTNDERWD